MKRHYALTKEQWRAIEPFVPGNGGYGTPGRRAINNRQTLECILFKHRTGTPWRSLPEYFGPWNRAALRLLRWRRNGTWDDLQARLNALGVRLEEEAAA
jgi:putative transposase